MGQDFLDTQYAARGVSRTDKLWQLKIRANNLSWMQHFMAQKKFGRYKLLVKKSQGCLQKNSSYMLAAFCKIIVNPFLNIF